MSNLKKNILFNITLSTSNYIFPLIIFPYISRVLGVENLGLCNFVDSIINYFVLFSMMGMSIVGTREIASCHMDQQKLNKTFSSLFTLLLFTTTISLIALVVATIFVPDLREHKTLIVFGSLKLVGTIFLTEWFFTGIENFKYITMRSIFIKICYTISIFLFVKNSGEYWVYYLLLCMLTVCNAIFNSAYRTKFVTFSFKNIDLKPFLKPFLMLGAYLLLTSMYTSFNVAFLGFATNNTQVGYYTTASKIYTIIIALFTAFTSVMLPRMSSLLSEGKIKEFKQLTTNSFEIIANFSIPLIIFVAVFAPQIIQLIAGNGYQGAILPTRIIIPLTLIIGLEQILVIQIMMPLKLDKVIMRNSIIGALMGVSLNFLIVPQMAAVGSALVWICCELVILILSQICVYKNINTKIPIRSTLKIIIVFSPLLCMLLITTYCIQSWILLITAGVIITTLYVICVQFSLLKHSFCTQKLRHYLESFKF